MNVLLLATQSPDDRKTLCVIRALARAGIRFTLASNSFMGRSFHSRYLRNRALVPHPVTSPEKFLHALDNIVADGSFDVLLPTGDYTTFAMSRYQAEISGSAGIVVPPFDSALICKDKQATSGLAANLGIAVPRTFCPKDRAELEYLARDLGYPCVIKPRKSAGGVGMSLVSSPGALLDAFDALPAASDPIYDFSRPLIQQCIPGQVHEVCALFNRGQPRALLTQKRLLMYPSHGGAGIYNETTDEDDLREKAVTLLRALNWHGPAQVEFLREDSTGTPYLLEVNGRFWGTLDLSIAAGMNFPVLACCMAAEGDVECPSTYRVGLRYRWPYPFAILHATETGRWVGTVKDFLVPRRATRSDLDLTDPFPLIMEALYSLERFRRRGFKTLRSTKDWGELIADGRKTGTASAPAADGARSIDQAAGH